MKKFIFIMLTALLVLGLSQSYAQIPYLPPSPLVCIDLDDPLHPVPGTPYLYEVNVPNPPGNKSYHWLVTQDQTFITNKVLVANPEIIGASAILASGDVWYNVLTADADAITLTFQSFVLDPGDYVFVVIWVENNDGSCINNNLKVYRILPQHAFTLDLANVDSVANAVAADNLAQCVDSVASAYFDVTFNAPDGGVVYDFGTNTFYYVVAAANYSGQFELYAQFDGLQGATPAGTTGQTATISWGYSMGAITNGNLVVTNMTSIDLGMVVAPNDTVGQYGQMIYIKVVIDNNQFEAANYLDQYDYDLWVNGTLVDDAGDPLAVDDTLDDLTEGSPDCQTIMFDDLITQVLKARPTVESVSPVPPGFLPIEGP